MNTNKVLSAALALALAGALWAAVYPAGCAACQAGAAFFGLPLGWLGVGFYGVLLALHVRWPGTRGVAWALFAAAGAHLALAAVLIRMQTLCLPCVLTAVAVWAGAVAAWRLRPPRWDHAVALACVAALFTLGTYFVPLQQEAARQQAWARALLGELRTAHAEDAGEALWLVLFEREGCVHCTRFKEEYLPEVLAAYPEGVEVLQRTAPDGLWAPTVAALGPRGAAAHAGLPTPGMLWSIVPLAFGPPAFPE